MEQFTSLQWEGLLPCGLLLGADGITQLVLIKIFKGSSKGSSKYYIFPLFKTLADEEFFFFSLINIGFPSVIFITMYHVKQKKQKNRKEHVILFHSILF